MSRLITGAEFRHFYKNNWPSGAWHEDMELEYVDIIEDEIGNYILPDDATLDLDRLGYVCFPKEMGGDYRPFADVYFEVMCPKKEIVLTWVVPNDLKEQAIAAMAALGLHPVRTEIDNEERSYEP